MLGAAVDRFRARARRSRAETFRELFPVSASTRVLDLGGGNGSHIHYVLRATPALPENVCVADIDELALKDCASRFGFTSVVIDENGRLPFPDRAFDIVFCSSVIEHVTVPKKSIWLLRSGRGFRELARRRQLAFAEEIRRVGKGYLVQVPYPWFPIESHTWLPFFNFLPRPAQIRLMRLTNRFWVKQSVPDFHLPTTREMRACFPDARILREKFLGLTKSLIACKVT